MCTSRRSYDALRRFPIATVLGPRQCGKTTFIRQALPDWTYLDLERPSDAAPVAADPEARLEQLSGRVILDEAQRLPDLFPVLRGVVDRGASRAGRFVLLGSASPALVRRISESLAGRTAFLDLPPFRWDEVASRGGTGALSTLWSRGGFPTVNRYVDILDQTFLIRKLPAYVARIRKRLVKSPKVYFRDTWLGDLPDRGGRSAGPVRDQAPLRSRQGRRRGTAALPRRPGAVPGVRRLPRS